MSAASPDADDGGLPEHSTDQESWDELGNPAQRDELVGAMQERSMGGGDGEDDDDARDWDDYDEPTKSKTLAAIEQSLDDTWTVEAFEALDGKRTIPVEVFELSGEQGEALDENAELIYRVSQLGEDDDIEDVDDLRDELGDEADALFDDLEDVEDWLFGFLGDVTEDPELDREWWTDGSGYPDGLLGEVLSEIIVHRQERQQAANSFREERLR